MEGYCPGAAVGGQAADPLLCSGVVDAPVPAQEVQRTDAAEPAWEPAPEPAWLPPAEEAPSADALPEDQVAGGEQGSMFE